MKLICPKSGTIYTTSSGFGSAKIEHPILSLPLATLTKVQVPAYLAGKMDNDDAHLLHVALINKLPIARWDCAIIQTEETEKVFKAQFKSILAAAARVDYFLQDDKIAADRRLRFIPKFAISTGTADMSRLSNYLFSLNRAINEHLNTKSKTEREQLTFVTEKIFQLVRDTEGILTGRNRLPALVASWATMVGNFPYDEKVNHNGKAITKAEYWKALIIASFNPVTLIADANRKQASALISDYKELIDFCECYIPYGSLHTDILLQNLRGGLEVIEDFVKPLSFSIDLNLLTRPESESPTKNKDTQETQTMFELSKTGPQRKDFKSGVDYLRARSRWALEVRKAGEAKS